MTELCDRVAARGGPALLFEQPRPGPTAHDSGARQPVRHAAARGAWRWARTTTIGAAPARHRPAARVPEGARAAEEPDRRMANTRPVFMKVLDMAPKERTSAPCQEVVWEGADVDLARLPIQTCWPGDAGAADHVGAHGDARPAQEAAEPRHLPPAGDRAQQGDHALARASRRRAGFSRSRARASRARRFRSRSRWAPIPRRSWAR